VHANGGGEMKDERVFPHQLIHSIGIQHRTRYDPRSFVVEPIRKILAPPGAEIVEDRHGIVLTPETIH
jgi:hypothetical protein